MSEFLIAFAGLITLVAAIGVISSKEAVHSALYLTVHLLGIGALFLALHHQFLAVAQMLVYAGAVMVVFIFAVTTLSPHEEPLKLLDQNGLPLVGVGAGIFAFIGLFWTYQNNQIANLTQQAESAVELAPASSFAYDLFGRFLLPFEGTAFLLLTALIGAIILGGRRQIGDG
ncbi:MAG: NADH-quinone oxidoreductase subunit J [Candidatus Eremiobacteraeota bacterium]|nr:NADH-quinone oxidoreductase subunit J [Candidatus Eremiobacteraeota bacterium]